jgi:hypothetical protein
MFCRHGFVEWDCVLCNPAPSSELRAVMLQLVVLAHEEMEAENVVPDYVVFRLEWDRN